MLAGEVYTYLDADLETERQRAESLLRLYNVTEAIADRDGILLSLLRHIGTSSIIEPPSTARTARTSPSATTST